MKDRRDWAAVGQRVREERMRAGLTQIQLAAKAGITPVTLSKLETGARDDYQIGKARQVWAALGLDVADMMRVLHAKRPTPSDVVEALRSDPELAEDDRRQLIELYQRFRRKPTG